MHKKPKNVLYKGDRSGRVIGRVFNVEKLSPTRDIVVYMHTHVCISQRNLGHGKSLAANNLSPRVFTHKYTLIHIAIYVA